MKGVKKMEELKVMYKLMLETLREEHAQWVNSNEKINSLADALRKIGDNGDTPNNHAVMLLKKELDNEAKRNGELTSEMYAHKRLIRDFEHNAKRYNLELNGTMEIFGY